LDAAAGGDRQRAQRGRGGLGRRRVAGEVVDRLRRSVEDRAVRGDPHPGRAADIPPHLYEAAAMDGASAWRRFTSITLPLVKPALVVAVLFRTLDALRMY